LFKSTFKQKFTLNKMGPFLVYLEGRDQKFVSLTAPEEISFQQAVISGEGPIFLSETGQVYLTSLFNLVKLPLTQIVQISASLQNSELWSLDKWGQVYQTHQGQTRLLKVPPIVRIQYPHLITTHHEIYRYQDGVLTKLQPKFESDQNI